MDNVHAFVATVTVLDFVPLGAFVTDADLTVLFWNKSLEEWTHLSRDRMIGQPITHQFPHLNQPKYLSRLRQIFEGGHSIIFSSQLHPHLIPVQGVNGEFRVQHTTVTAIPGETDGHFYALWSIQDVTDLHNQVSNYRTEQAKAWKEVAARQRTELSLQEMNLALEHAVSGISRLDPQGRYTLANQAYARMLGYDPEALIGMPWQQSVHPDELETMAIAYERMLQDGRVEIETRGRRQDGSVFYKQVVMVASYDEEHQFQGHYCFSKDISDRKHAEIALQESEMRFRTMADCAPILIWVSGLDGRCTFFNQTWLDFTGRTLAQEMGNGWTECIHPDDLKHCLDTYLTAFAARQPFQTEYRLKRADGVYRWLEDRGAPRFTPDGSFAGFIGSCIDIDDRKQSEAQLRRYERIVSASPDCISLLDHNYCYQAVNQTYTLWNQKTVDDIVGHSVSDLLGQEFFELLAKVPLDCCLAGSKDEMVESWVDYADGQRRFVRATYAPYVELDGTISGVIINVHDLTALKRSEQENRSLRKRLEFLLEASPVVLYSCQPDGDFGGTFISKNVKTLLGYTPAEFLADPTFWLHRVHPDDAATRLTWLQSLPKEGHHVTEYRFRHKDGHYCWMQDEFRFVLNADGHPIEVVGCFAVIDDRKQAEAQLQALSERLNLAVRSAQIGIWDLDVVNDQLVWDDRLYAIYGIAAADFGSTNEAWLACVHPDDRAHCQMTYEQSLARQQDYYCEFRIIRPDGSLRYIESHALIQRAPDGTPLRMIGINLDISDRKAVEIALQNSQARFAGILEIASDAIISVNAQQQITLFNQGAEQIFGYTAVEIIGQPLDTLLPSRFIQAHQHHVNHYTQASSGARPMAERGEIFGRRKDGTEFPAEASIAKLDLNGEVIFTTFLRDVTVRRQSEAEMARLAAIVESSEDAIISKTLDGIITSWNAGAEAIFGYTAAEMIGQSIRKLMLGGDLTEETHILNQIRQGKIVNNFDTQRLHKDGSLVDLSVSISPIKDANGHVIGASKIARDIRDRKQKEIALQQAMEAAEAANLAKSMFLANMSHELRTPLNVILGFTQVMAHDPALTPSQKQDLETIHRSGDHLLSLINDVLDLSKIEAGHLSLDETGFDLIALLHTLRTMMAERAKAKGLQLEFKIAPEVPQFVIADEQKLRQVLLNLLSNAIKFTKHGHVTLTVVRHQASNVEGSFKTEHRLDSEQLKPAATFWLQFDVTDTGVGIAPAEQATIFDAFVQAEAGQRSVSGTGLGLTISRKLLELIHGSIAVRSMPNSGSTFTVTIPIQVTNHVHAQPKEPDRLVIGLVPGQPHRRILVVDDQAENRLVVVRLLSQLGLEVKEASDGTEAIRIWQDWHPDLTWMDIRMPGMDGYEATQQIRAIEQEEHSIIIALTAQASHSDRTLALAAGCNDYISKPFREATLLLKLQEYLGLEYIYAAPPMPTVMSTVLTTDPQEHTTHWPEVALLDRVSPEWLSSLEEAAVCGSDREITTLARQLPPSLESLGTRLIDLAERYEFEQILQIISTSEVNSPE